MNLSFLKRFAISFTVLVFGAVFSREIFLKNDSAQVEEESVITSIKKKINRKIASLEKKQEQKNIQKFADSSLTTSRNQFRDLEIPDAMSDGNLDDGKTSSEGKSSYAGGVRGAARNSKGPTSPTSPSRGSKNVESNSRNPGEMVMAPLGLGFPQGGNLPNDNQTETYGSNSDNFDCNTSIGGGAYGNPISVSLTCTSTATVKYCLQEGSCCDPQTAGTVYSAPLVIGATDGNYCLTYTGASATGAIVSHQKNYVISNTLPHLQVNVPKIQYQTTQLPGVHHLQSNHFGEAGYSIGEVNLKLNDPGPLALNLSCADIVNNYSTLAAPTPEEMFATLLASSIPSGTQLNVPFPLSKIVYGNNFITSFIINSNHATDVHSCSTNKIIVADFELFPLEATHGETGNNAVREFSGGFIGYSFFESDTNLNRTPAGTSAEDESGQELRTNSFSIYH